MSHLKAFCENLVGAKLSSGQIFVYWVSEATPMRVNSLSHLLVQMRKARGAATVEKERFWDSSLTSELLWFPHHTAWGGCWVTPALRAPQERGGGRERPHQTMGFALTPLQASCSSAGPCTPHKGVMNSGRTSAECFLVHVCHLTECSSAKATGVTAEVVLYQWLKQPGRGPASDFQRPLIF